jgi:hypothetical protein
VHEQVKEPQRWSKIDNNSWDAQQDRGSAKEKLEYQARKADQLLELILWNSFGQKLQ